MSKAERTLSSARLLLEHGDADGARNRAYYAMFEVARAALIASGFSEVVAGSRTHQGLISAFGLHMVKTGLADAVFGIGINKVERLRKLADYTGDPVSASDASWAVKQAEAFVEYVRNLIVRTGQRIR